MARTAKPWFNGQKNCWMVWLNSTRVRLAEGKKNKKVITVVSCSGELAVY
jgi:hypothetical protein